MTLTPKSMQWRAAFAAGLWGLGATLCTAVAVRHGAEFAVEIAPSELVSGLG